MSNAKTNMVNEKEELTELLKKKKEYGKLMNDKSTPARDKKRYSVLYDRIKRILNAQINRFDIEKCITISTAHIKEETVNFLESLCDDKNVDCPIVAYKKGDVGYWIYVPSDFAGITDKKVPSDLWCSIAFAHRNECQWLCLDRDGQIINSLQRFDW